MFAFKRPLKIFWPTAVGLLLLESTVLHLCIMPMFPSDPFNAIILIVYSFILAACSIISSSHYFHCLEDEPEYVVRKFIKSQKFF